jgi:MFS transporter, putative metabolite:H+ symporter
MAVSEIARPRDDLAERPATPDEILGRIERLPLSSWQISTRIIVGTATFFDAFDALSIAYVLPVIVPMWNLAFTDVSLLISAGYVGQLIGALIGGSLAERYGRRPVVIVSVLWFGVLSLACGFAWSYPSLVVLRLLQGLGLGAEVPVAATYISELAKAKGRGKFVLLFELVFPVGLVAAALLGKWIVPNLGWQYLFFVGGIPALFALFMMRNLPESPRWLASRGRAAEATEAIAFIEDKVKIATGAPLPAPQPVAAKVGTQPAHWTDLFGRAYLSRTLVIWLCWFAAYFANYGLATWLPTVYQNIFKLPLEQALTYGLAAPSLGLLSSLTCALLIDYIGRRIWFAGAFAVGATAFIVLWWIGPTTPERVLVLSSISYMAISTLSLALYLYTSELYPTRVRAFGTSAGTAWLRLASIIGPYVVGTVLARGSLGEVFLVFGLVVLIASIVVALFATETKGRVLEEISP